MSRNARAIQSIRDVPVEYPFRFAMLGDIRSAEDPRFTQLFRQIEQLDPPPLFIASLGDFAAPCDESRNTRFEPYLELVDRSDIPIVSVVGNHDIEDGFEKFHSYCGEENFVFDYGNTGFVAIHSACGNPSRGIFGPREQDMAFLGENLKGLGNPNRIVLMHIPPYLENEFAWKPGMAGFKEQEGRFRELVERHSVSMVACAHNQCFNRCSRNGVEYVVSGGGGWEVPYWEDSTDNPPWRGLFFHFVLMEVHESGQMAGRVFKINEGTTPDPAYDFAIP